LNPTTDAKNLTLFDQHSVDSARHGRVSCCPDALLASRTPAAIRRKASKNVCRVDLQLVDLADLADLANLADLAAFGDYWRGFSGT
jgi:hypothetical protein